VLTIILLRKKLITRRNKQEGEVEMRGFVDKVKIGYWTLYGSKLVI